VDSGLISGCVTFNNGWIAGDGNIGQWCYDSRAVTIANGSSYGNKSVTGRDGGGFDIDGGSTGCVIRDCQSWNNTGSGYLVFEYGSPNPMRHNTILRCSSKNDGTGIYTSYMIGGYAALYDTRIQDCTGKGLVFFNKQFVIGLAMSGTNF
jgi:hypothetical protein